MAVQSQQPQSQTDSKQAAGRVAASPLSQVLLYEGLDRLARCPGLIAELTPRSDIPESLMGQLQKQWIELQSTLFQRKAELPAMLAEAVSPHTFSAWFKPHKQALLGFYQLLDHLGGYAPLAETREFLDDALPLTLLPGVTDRAVVVDMNCQSQPLVMGHVVVESLSLCRRNTPLGWLGLGHGYVQALYQQHQARLASLGDASTIHALLALKLLGPAFYFQSALSALLQEDFTALGSRLPLMSQALSYLGYQHPSLDQVNQWVQDGCICLAGQATETLSNESVSDETLKAILSAVSEVLPAEKCFTPERFQQALLLIPRLEDGILLSASRPTATDALKSVLDQDFNPAAVTPKVSPAHGNGRLAVEISPVYRALGMAGEVPHQSLEIIHAGWIHRLNTFSTWIMQALLATDPVDGFAQFQAGVEQRDHLLIKSIETAAVHRVLYENPPPEIRIGKGGSR